MHQFQFSILVVKNDIIARLIEVASVEESLLGKFNSGITVTCASLDWATSMNMDERHLGLLAIATEM